MESLGYKIILTMQSVMVVEVFTDGSHPFRRVIEEYDSRFDYDAAMDKATQKLKELQYTH